jgi:hypothetical protein
MTATSTRAALAAFVCLIFTEASAQPSDDLGAAGSALQDSPEAVGATGAGGHQGRHRRHDREQPAAIDKPAPLKVKPDPVQRLEQGALLCDTEGELQQHQAAVAARMSGGSAPEPSGCRILSGTTAVTVVERHGLASTEVSLPAPAGRQGCTDSLVHDPASK